MRTIIIRQDKFYELTVSSQRQLLATVVQCLQPQLHLVYCVVFDNLSDLLPMFFDGLFPFLAFSKGDKND